jgi:hypothetical protein
MVTVITKPRRIKPDRASTKDLEAYDELNSVLAGAGLWIFSPPIYSNESQGGLTCSVRGLAFSATSTADIYCIVPYGYASDSAAGKRLDAAHEALQAADYDIRRIEWRLLVRVNT